MKERILERHLFENERVFKSCLKRPPTCLIQPRETKYDPVYLDMTSNLTLEEKPDYKIILDGKTYPYISVIYC